MLTWFQQSFQENSVLWLLVSSILGGIIGASMRFVFEVILPQRLQRKREVIAVKRKYATPILLAAEDLRRRLENIIKIIETIDHRNVFSVRDPPGYYYLSTLYVVGQFFGWVQILRRTVAYLDFTTTKETRKYERFLAAIEDGFSSPSLLGAASTSYPADTQDHWVFTFQLQAIGSLMVDSETKQDRTRDYISFCKAYSGSENKEFRRWFAPLSAMFQNLKAEDPRFRRIVAIHAILNAFIEAVDPKHLRTEKHPYHKELLSEQECGSLDSRISEIVTL